MVPFASSWALYHVSFIQTEHLTFPQAAFCQVFFLASSWAPFVHESGVTRLVELLGIFVPCRAWHHYCDVDILFQLPWGMLSSETNGAGFACAVFSWCFGVRVCLWCLLWWGLGMAKCSTITCLTIFLLLILKKKPLPFYQQSTPNL